MNLPATTRTPWCLILLLTGCVPTAPSYRPQPPIEAVTNAVAGPSQSGATRPAPGPAPTRYPIVTVIERSIGKVTGVNTQAMFVVVDFGFNPLPRPEQRLTVFRTNQAVGTVRMTGAPNGSFMAGDIMSGEARTGDEVRDE
ncbi:MAG: hypothetical protein KA191_06420 [Verrucomicrobia bacterium]|nr:hypothetical protein [Verrucomicrobiota bacterium]OQC65367.1 MAG: hypothetical protein BWX48_02551 [Verrucomicrobia bacterium ADurb.Bin006]NMD22446.1 hypothetical protein [Verrucomicrobiota bacterium]HNV00353.1 hypothetical protein [Verrucomicrobiota bacterium]HOA62326.1 hypothetical protein [Verrucomicrobiota bacterium]